MNQNKKMKRPILIGVTGGSGSGKTTVSKAIYDSFPNKSLLILQQDAYYNDQSDMSMEERKKVNYDHPNAFDNNLLLNHLNKLLNYESIEKPVYDYTKFTRSTETVHQDPKDVII